MDGLWSRLPDELVERVLPYLLVSDLCRFRSVCKRWNSLIGTLEFDTLCVQNASKVARIGASLVIKIRVYNPRISPTAEIQSYYDFNARKWYNIKHEIPKGDKPGCQSMDGGLVCRLVDAFTDEQRRTSTINMWRLIQPQILIISNLLGGTIKVLPNPLLVGLHDLYLLNLKLVVDNKSHTYKVFVKCMDGVPPPRDPCMCVYESSTNQWQIAPNLPKLNPVEKLYKIFGRNVRSVWFQGLLHVFCPMNSCVQLYSYNFLKNAWEDTSVQFCESTTFSHLQLERCDLVVSDKRLFFMAQCFVDHTWREYQEEQFACTLDISEILLADKALKKVVRLTPAKYVKNSALSRTCSVTVNTVFTHLAMAGQYC